MPGAITMIVTLLSGFALGVLFYGGPWFTIRALPRSRNPTLLVLASFWLRTALAVGGFVLAMAGRWQNAVVCLLGFTLARFVLARWIPVGWRTGRAAE